MADRALGSDRADAVDTRRYLAAIRRDLPLIGALAIGLAIFALALSLVLPKSYSASALVGFDLSQTANVSSDAQERNINTQQELVTAARVLSNATVLLTERGITADTNELLAATTVSAVFGKNVLEITARSEQPKLAAAYANAVADAYVARSEAIQRSALDAQIKSYEARIKAAPSEALRQQYEAALQAAIIERDSQEGQVQTARAALVPGGPDSPKPVRNAVLALFVGLFLGTLLALLRDQLRPRFSNQRDLGQFLELPVIATIPELGRRLGVRANPQAMRVEQEAYQSLSAALRLALPPTQTHIVMLTSSMHAEGKTTVASRVARLLASSGHRTLLISGDLRWPRLDTLLHVEDQPGISDLLAAHQAGTITGQQLTDAIVPGAGRERVSGGADILPAGTKSSDAARLLSGGSVEPVIDAIRRLGYTYVIIDAPPILGIADAKLLARTCDRVLVVGRLERISVPAALDLRDELGRLDVPILGLVAIGGVTEASPYYSGARAPATA